MPHVPPPPPQPSSMPSPPHGLPARSNRLVPVALAIVLGLGAGYLVREVWPPELPPPPGIDLDCDRSLATYSVSRLENGDVVALLQELGSEEDVLERLRQQDRDFRFDPESLYCLAQAAVPLGVLREMLAPPKPVEIVKTVQVSSKPKVEEPSGVLLPRGTPIVLQLQQEVHTKSIGVGQSVPMEVAEAVQVDGVTVISRGAPVYAEVRRARRGRIMGKGAELALELTTVRAVDGQMLPLKVTLAWSANSKDEAVSFVEGVDQELRDKYDRDDEVAKFSLGVFVRGQNVILPSGMHLTIFNPAAHRVRASAA